MQRTEKTNRRISLIWPKYTKTYVHDSREEERAETVRARLKASGVNMLSPTPAWFHGLTSATPLKTFFAEYRLNNHNNMLLFGENPLTR